MKILKWTGAGVLLWLVASPAFAVVCEDDGDARYMDFEPIGGGSATCFLSGSTPPAEGKVQKNEPYNFTEIEKLEGEDGDDLDGNNLTVTGLNGLEGGTTFTQALYNAYNEIFVTFKYGNGNGKDNDISDWFTYRIVDVYAADWRVEPDQQSLSHITLYGSDDYTEVPGPAPLALLGLGLLGMTVVVGRRRG